MCGIKDRNSQVDCEASVMRQAISFSHYYMLGVIIKFYISYVIIGGTWIQVFLY